MDEIAAIRDKLKQYKLSYVWLIHELEKRNVRTDKTEVSSVFAGMRKGAKADAILKNSKKLLREYEYYFLHMREHKYSE